MKIMKEVIGMYNSKKRCHYCGWDILYDINRNGTVDLEDVEIVLANCDVVL